MPDAASFRRAAILGTGLIGGSFAFALRKYAPETRVTGWDRPEVIRNAASLGAIQEAFSGDLAPALAGADLVYVALPIGVTLDLLPEIARHAPPNALVTDACSTKARVCRGAAELFAAGALFLGGHPMAGKELSGIALADADLFRGANYGLIAPSSGSRDPRCDAFLALLEKIGARPVWLDPERHDLAVALVSHLPQLASVALASLLHDEMDETGLPVTLAGPGLRDALRLAGSPYSLWRDIVLTNREHVAQALDALARRLDDLREHLASRELEAEFDAANKLYKLLRSL
jgi:prephenate dehydrogenase